MLNHSDLSTVKVITVGDYCSATPGVLQISPTIRILVPRIKNVVKGVEFWFRILAILLVLIVLLKEANLVR